MFDAFVDLLDGHLTGEAGDLAAAERLLEQASARFTSLGHRRGAAMAQMALSPLYEEHHDLWRAHLATVRTMELLAGSGNRRLLLMARERLADSWVMLGCYEAAAAEVTPLLAELEQRGLDTDVAFNLVTLGQACDGLGDPATAEAHLTRGLTAMERSGETSLLRLALPEWGRFLLRHDRPLEAELAATRAVELAGGTRHLQHGPLGLLARALLAQGRTSQARDAIEAVWADISAAPASADSLELLLDCHVVLAAAGQHDGAAEAIDRAQTRLRAVAVQIDDHAVRAAFLTRVPACREVAAAGRQPPAAD